MKTDDIIQYLDNHGIRPTSMRILILKSLCNASKPMSAQEIEDALETADRSTISRTLSTFTDKNLVHLIDDGTGIFKYECCPSSHHDADETSHVHFHCQVCGHTFCLHDVTIPSVPLPTGYTVTSRNYVLKGTCPSCQRNI